MGPLTYSLCHKPVIGLVMYITSACAFPPLFYDEPFALQRAGARVVKEVEAPIDHVYKVNLAFHFPSAQARDADTLVGSRYDANCERAHAEIPEAQREGLGRPIPIHVRVWEKPGGALILDKTFDYLCMSSSSPGEFIKTRSAARVELRRGRYLVEVHNVIAQPALDGVKTTLGLVPGGGK